MLHGPVEDPRLRLCPTGPRVRARQIDGPKLAFPQRRLLVGADRSDRALVGVTALLRRSARCAGLFVLANRRAVRTSRLVDLVIAQLSQRIERIPRRTHGRRRRAYRTDSRSVGFAVGEPPGVSPR